jgi:formylmethanofuran dehydrogenase subunit C
VTGLVLRLRQPLPCPVDASPLQPEALLGRAETEVARIGLVCGGRRLPLGEIAAFGRGPEGTLVIEGDARSLRHLGNGATRGRILVAGDAGDHLGAGLAGAEIEVRGSAGDHLAAGMVAGRIRVRGGAGDFACAAPPGGGFGMRGGLVVVDGPIGARAGDRMRRGVLVGLGGIGAFAGAFMLGGTLLVSGPVGRDPGLSMRRGTLLFTDGAEAPPTFRDDGAHDFLWLALLSRYLRAEAGIDPLPAGRMRRFAGCASVGGAGELLVPARRGGRRRAGTP